MAGECLSYHEKTMTKSVRSIPNVGRRERAKIDKMQRILEASSFLFKKQGFDRTTTQQIAEKADVGTGTLFLYVSDKSELLLLLFHQALEKKIQLAGAELERRASFEIAVSRFFSHLFDCYAEDLDLARIFIREFLFHSGKVRQKLDEQTSRMLELLEKRVVKDQARGEIDGNLNPKEAALHVYSLYHAALAFSLAGCNPAEDPKLLFGMLIKTMMKGFQPRAARR